MICLPPQRTRPPHSSRYGPQHTQHTASTAATPHFPQGRSQTPADAPTPLKRSMLTPFGGPRPRFGAKARERWFTRSNGSDLKKIFNRVNLNFIVYRRHVTTCWSVYAARLVYIPILKYARVRWRSNYTLTRET